MGKKDFKKKNEKNLSFPQQLCFLKKGEEKEKGKRKKKMEFCGYSCIVWDPANITRLLVSSWDSSLQVFFIFNFFFLYFEYFQSK